jgi:hypothetical protein
MILAPAHQEVLIEEYRHKCNLVAIFFSLVSAVSEYYEKIPSLYLHVKNRGEIFWGKPDQILIRQRLDNCYGPKLITALKTSHIQNICALW